MPDLFTERTCYFSPDRQYRYRLSIIWDRSRKPQMFIGLNPSTADEQNDDPTVRRCIDFARRWGAGGLVMTNACAYRATNPKVMLAFTGDQVGPENTMLYLRKIAEECQGHPIAAWGRNATKVPGREMQRLNRHDYLRREFGRLDCLGLNADGTPVHPLYQPAIMTPGPFNYEVASHA